MEQKKQPQTECVTPECELDKKNGNFSSCFSHAELGWRDGHKGGYLRPFPSVLTEQDTNKAQIKKYF